MSRPLQLEILLPPEIERFPWAGHLGSSMIADVIAKLEHYTTSLIFTNTRSQAEIWYQRMLEHDPSLFGKIALHHGSIHKDERAWIENALRLEKMKAVVCTSSLDLGVDFPSVDAVFHIGSPKGVSRFMQRSGRSGHSPDKQSHAYFVPTNSLELLDYLALTEAVKEGIIEQRELLDKPYDVLMQYLVTLSVSDGFNREELFAEVIKTYSYRNLTPAEWNAIVLFLEQGGPTLHRYERYHKIHKGLDDRYYIANNYFAREHKATIGTITENAALKVKFLRGKSIGTIEENFISKLQPGDSFVFAGKNLQYAMLHDTTLYVRTSKKKRGAVPRWFGSNLTFSTLLSEKIKTVLDRFPEILDPNVAPTISPLLQLQATHSHLPGKDLLIEHITVNRSHNIFIYPLAGKTIHEGLAALLAYRISQVQPISFAISVNDYGLQLASDTKIRITQQEWHQLCSTENLERDILASANMTEMAKRRFRAIAQISGLVSKGSPGKSKPVKHLQSSTSILFEVLEQFEKDNVLVAQAYKEVMEIQLEEKRLREVLETIRAHDIILVEPKQLTPFAFPLFVEKYRDKVSSEDFKTKIAKLRLKLESPVK